MATPKKSRLDELADKVTVEVRPSAGAPAVDPFLESEAASNAAEREARIAATMRISEVPRNVAAVMVDTGYSKGTAHRIINDAFKRQTREREAAHAAEQERKAGQAGAGASA